MDFNNLLIRIISSLFFILVFSIVIIFYESFLYVLALLIYSIIFIEILFYFTNKKNNYFFLITYFLCSLIACQLYLFYSYEKNLFLYFIFLIIIFDMSSYFFGVTIGKTKIFPKISPNKTYAGFIGGILFTLITSLIYNYFMQIFNLYTAFLFSFIIIISAFIGDIIESYFKRLSLIKNSSNFLPGHGGFFDRLDGFIMSFISIFIFSILS